MTLNEAINFATNVHQNEFRKRYRAGTRLPYLTHCLEVMKKVWTWGAGTEEMMIIAVLHDVKESLATPISIDILPPKIDEILDELTFIPGADPKAEKEVYIASFGQKSIRALVVKLADRICNTLDFYLTDPMYARKYFEKADALHQVFVERFEEVEQEFGEEVATAIVADWNNTERKINVQ